MRFVKQVCLASEKGIEFAVGSVHETDLKYVINFRPPISLFWGNVFIHIKVSCLIF